jgi:hypothetical protein
MGEPNYRLNPQIESSIRKTFLIRATQLLLSFVMLLPPIKHHFKGTRPYDYRVVIALCILRVLLRKTYADYEIEMRTDLRICRILGLKILPGKSTIQRGMKLINMKLLYEINWLMLAGFIKGKMDMMIDSSGIRIIGRSIWFCLRIKQEISKRDCDKAHLAVSSQFMFIMNWKITRYQKNDCPFFKKLLAPFKSLGIVSADKGYLSRENFQLVADKGGEAFIPFKKGKKKGSTAKAKNCPAWKFQFYFWKTLNGIYMSIYHQRSRIEAVFSALKRRYGDSLHCRTASMRRKEMAMRFIAYNIKLLICYKYTKKNNLPLWVRINKD